MSCFLIIKPIAASTFTKIHNVIAIMKTCPPIYIYICYNQQELSFNTPNTIIIKIYPTIKKFEETNILDKFGTRSKLKTSFKKMGAQFTYKYYNNIVT